MGALVGRTRNRMAGAVRSVNIGERASKLRLPEVRKGGGATPAGEEDVRLDRLERLATLHEKGVLDDEEFAAEKARVLNRGNTPE